MCKDSTTNITFPIMISEFCIIVLYISFSTKVSEWCIVRTCATVLSSVPRAPDWLGPVGWSSLGWAWNLHLEMEYWGWKSKIKAHPLSSAASCFSTPNVIGLPCYFFWILYKARPTVLTEAFLLLSQGCTALSFMSFHVGGFFSRYQISSNGFLIAKEKREIWCNAMRKGILASSQSTQSSF